MPRFSSRPGALILASTVSFMASAATAGSDAPIVVTQFENDLFAGQDEGYTNGVSFSLIPDDSTAPEWIAEPIRAISTTGAGTGELPYSLSLEQLIFTPSDITDPELPPADRPYAGWLNLSGSVFAVEGNQLERWQLSIGIVGPASLAEESQKSVHGLTGADDPVGWDTQLPNEPTLQLGWDRQWRFPVRPDDEGVLLEMAPTIGVTAGNAITGAEVGGFVRIGDNIPVDFGPPRLRSLAGGSGLFIPEQGFGWYVYAGGAVQVTAHEIFLDGSLVRDTPSVSRDPHRGQAYFGFACYHGPTRIAFTQVIETPAFDNESGVNRLGAVSLSWRL